MGRGENVVGPGEVDSSEWNRGLFLTLVNGRKADCRAPQ